LDSRAYREPLSKAVASTFEVDHPATQMDKIRRVKRVLGREPANLTWVPLDFNAGTLDILFDFRFDRQRKTLFILEGLVPYLEAKAVDTTLGWIRAHAAPGSAIILDYQQASPLARRDRTYAVLSRASGEARAFVIPRGQSSYFLSRLGFAHIVEALAEDLKRLYCRGPNAGRAVSEDYAIVRAEIPA